MSNVAPLHPHDREDGPGRPNVVIDGVEYVPADSEGLRDVFGHPIVAPVRIGIGITTRNRNEQLLKTLAEHVRYLPPGAKVVVVDDASNVPIAQADYRFEENVGIARAKNKCLDLLVAGPDAPDHIFLFDDDTYPVADEWWKPYVESPEPHLMYQFLDLAGRNKLHDVAELYRDSEHFALSGPRGVMLYVERRVLDVVGGMDPIYRSFGYEHGDWSNRIHHAGLTSWRYADVVGSDKLIHSMDEHEEIPRSVPRRQREQEVARNVHIHDERRRSRYQAYVEYREPRDVILTSFFTSKPDPQRPRGGALDWSATAALAKSVVGQDVVVIADTDGDRCPAAWSMFHHELTINVYVERHLAAYQYLRAHPEIRWVWCVDATDVVMQVEPWAHMDAGKLYLGWEPKIVGDEWMTTQHSSDAFHAPGGLFAEHGDDQLLNMGVIGGDRETVMAFLHALTSAYFDIEIHRFLKVDKGDSGIGDMGLGNLVAYRDFAGRIVTGSRIATVFKTNEVNDFSFWRHK